MTETVTYYVGDVWYSYDNGKTWELEPDIRRVRGEPNERTMKITKIDHLRGEITVEVG